MGQLKTRLVEYELSGQPFDLFVARPEGREVRPAVLVIHAWSGRDRFIEGKARQLAQLGYVGVGIDLYGVGRRGQGRESSQALMMELVGQPSLLRARLEEAVARASQLEEVGGEALAAMGYCFGGTCAILAARMGLPLAGVVSFHGLLKIGESLGQRPKGPLLILHGEDDPFVPPEDLEAFGAEMERIGADWRLVSYPGAQHAFAIPKAHAAVPGNAYHPEADQRSWAEAKSFLAEILGN